MATLPNKKCKDIKKVIKILDSSPIQLRGLGYDDWSKQHATRHIQGLKLHVEYDLTLRSPSKVITSYANLNDASMGKRWPIIKDTIYVFDRGYYDYNWWWSIHQNQAYFVTRLKKNAAIIIEGKKGASQGNILQDHFFRISKKVPRGGKRMEYSEALRLISVKREGKSPLILVTNIKDLPAEKVAELYKSRWEIELFFKWIKQNLKIKKFLGRSENAVKIQIATAIIAYLLVQIFKTQSNGSLSLRLTLTWAKYNLSMILPRKIKLKPPLYPPSNVKRTEGAYL
jgi:IS4 transposase